MNKTMQYTDEEKEVIMAAAMDTPQGKAAFKGVMDEVDIPGKIHKMLVDAAGGEEEFVKYLPFIIETWNKDLTEEEKLERAIEIERRQRINA